MKKRAALLSLPVCDSLASHLRLVILFLPETSDFLFVLGFFLMLLAHGSQRKGSSGEHKGIAVSWLSCPVFGRAANGTSPSSISTGDTRCIREFCQRHISPCINGFMVWSLWPPEGNCNSTTLSTRYLLPLARGVYRNHRFPPLPPFPPASLLLPFRLPPS